LWLALALVVGVLAVLPSRSKKSYPKEWDARVTDLVTFVEQARGLQFKHPVHFDFFTDEAFDKLVATERAKPNPERRRTQDAVLRARGYVGPTFDSSAAEDDLVSNVSGFYNHVDKKMRVRGLTLSADVKLTLVHELTHALQDQHFNISHLYAPVDSDEKAFGLRSLIEGDARDIENRYFQSRSKAEQQEIDQIEHPDGQPQLDAVPEALVVQQLAPYELGALLAITLRHLGGVERLNQAFASPPKGEAGVVLPFAVATGSSIDLPAFPTDGTEVSGADTFGQLSTGPLSTFLTLSSRIEPIVAWRAALGWGNEDLRAMKRGNGDICVDSLVIGKTPEDTDRLRAAYERWAAAAPKATVSDSSGAILVKSCDASSAAPEPRTDIFGDLYQLSEADLAFYDEAERGGASNVAATCATLRTVQSINPLDFSQDEFTSQSVPAAAADAIREALVTCR
jgi:hypothetical protein